MTDPDERRLYERIADELRSKIAAGELLPGDKLPSIPEMVTLYGVSDGVGRRVIRLLVAEGLADARPGSGTYVRDHPEPRRLVRSFTFRLSVDEGSPSEADMQRRGHRVISTYKSQTVIAPDGIRERLALGEAGDEEDVVRTESLVVVDDEPSELTTSWEPLAITLGTPIVLPEDGPGVGVEERMRIIGIKMRGATETVSARVGTAQECAALRLPPGSTVLRILRTHYAEDGRRVETADIVVAADRYELLYGEPVPERPAP